VISDTLSDAIAEIDRYMADPVYPYASAEPAMKAWITAVRNDMELRAFLDNANAKLKDVSP
jgi:hypothetical protein